MPDVPDFQPDYDLIANRKGKRASDAEKAEICRCSRHMPMADLLQLTQRSEDSIRKYIRENEAADDATVRTRAEAYEHIVNPSPVQAAPQPRYEDDDDDYDEDPPPRGTQLPPPPPVELDLDDLFDDDDDVDPDEEHALSKKLYLLLIQKKAVKGDDAADTAGDIAKTYSMYPNYHNQHGTVEFLEGHDIKKRKAETIASLMFGWMARERQPEFNPGLVPGYLGSPPPGTAGYNPYQQPWGGGMAGVGQYQGYPGQPGGYPMYPPPPQYQMPEGKSVTKSDVVKAVTDAVDKNNEHWAKLVQDMDAKREKDDEKKALQETIDGMKGYIGTLEGKIDNLIQNPQTAPPSGDYESLEEPEHDDEGNIVRVRTTYKKVEDPQMTKMQQDYADMKSDIKEERELLTGTLKDMQEALANAQTETVRAEMAGQLKILEQKAEMFDQTQERLDAINEKMWAKEKEVMTLEHAASGEMSETMQAATMQKDMMQAGLNQFRLARQDITKTLLIISGKGKPAGVAEEQWDDDELAQLEGG